jgi:hypothetical protein
LLRISTLGIHVVSARSTLLASGRIVGKAGREKKMSRRRRRRRKGREERAMLASGPTQRL